MPISQEYKFLVEKRWRDWCLWQAYVPLGVLISIYLIGRFIAEAQFSFYRVFADGDLLIFSAMLLIEVSVEFRQIQISERKMRRNASVDAKASYALAFALLIFLLFGAVKIDMMKNDYFQLIPNKLIYYAIFSLATATGSLCFAIFSFWKVTEQLLEEETA